MNEPLQNDSNPIEPEPKLSGVCSIEAGTVPSDALVLGRFQKPIRWKMVHRT